MWPVTVLWIAALGSFLLFVPFYRKADRSAAGAYILFVVLYVLPTPGLPLLPGLWTAAGGYLFTFSLLAGGSLIIAAWGVIRRLPPSGEEGPAGPARRGVYRCLRHPQYAGFLVLSAGMLADRPAVPLLILWPVLLLAYHRLARREEEEMETQYGEKWREYAASTGRFLPRRRRRKRPREDESTST